MATSGIYIHQTEVDDKSYLTAVATDSHRMSISKVRLDQKINTILNMRESAEQKKGQQEQE